MYTPEEVINGLTYYVDNEIISKMDTTRKWIVGAVVGLAKENMASVVSQLQTNNTAKALGVVNADGMFDVDICAKHLKESAERYGKLQLDFPLIGTITLSADDVDLVRDYIRGHRR